MNFRRALESPREGRDGGKTRRLMMTGGSSVFRHSPIHLVRGIT
jgi:hypothetical protein